MKLIIAIIQPSRLEAVKAALTEVEVFRLTVMDCQGFGRQKGQTEVYRGHEFTINLLRKVQLQIAVNEEFVALDAFLRVLPGCLKPGGRAAILTFHSGEDRRVKKAFQAGLRDGVFQETSDGVITAGPEERRMNPRSSPAKLRWALVAC